MSPAIHTPYKIINDQKASTMRHSQIASAVQRGSGHCSLKWMHKALYEELHRAAEFLNADNCAIGMGVKIDQFPVETTQPDSVSTKMERFVSLQAKQYSTRLTRDRTKQASFFIKRKCTMDANLISGFDPKRSKPYSVFCTKIEKQECGYDFAAVPAQWMIQQIANGNVKIYFPRLFWPVPLQEELIQVIFDMATAYSLYGRTCFKQALEITLQRSGLPWNCLSTLELENDLNVLASLNDRFEFLNTASFN